MTNFGMEQNLNAQFSHHIAEMLSIVSMSSNDLYTHIYSIYEQNPLLEIIENEANSNYDDLQKDISTLNKSNSMSQNFSYSDNIENISDNQVFVTNLLSELKLLCQNHHEENLLYWLFTEIDLDNGYISCTNEDIQSHNSYISSAEILAFLRKIQDYCGNGLFTRNFHESFIVQMQSYGYSYNTAQDILNNLPLLRIRRKKEFQKIMNFTNDELIILLSRLKTIRSYSSNYVCQNSVPDVVISIHDNCVIHSKLPQIQIDSKYSELYNRMNPNSEYKRYLNQAKSLVNGIEYRFNLLEQLIYIVLNSKTQASNESLASALNISISTFNRLIFNKYVVFHGQYMSLKSFIFEYLRSNRDCKKYIENIIWSETTPLSDDKIAGILKEEYDIVISRRAVAKYRTEMNIPNIAFRKKFAPL